MTTTSRSPSTAKREADVEPRFLLVPLLRDTFGLTGTHVGCDTSNCGACTIHLNGMSAKSCTVLAVQCRRRGHPRSRAWPGATSIPSSRRSGISTDCSAASVRRG